jgi:ketosteroid isomerase-like protein
MSQQNVEIVQAGIEAWNAGDMAAFRELLAPDVILRGAEGWPEPGPWVGRDAVMRQWEQQRETFDANALERISDFIDAGDRVVVRMVWRGVGHGPEASLELTGVHTVRRGRVVLLEYFWDHSEALEAVGLSEQDAHAGP